MISNQFQGLQLQNKQDGREEEKHAHHLKSANEIKPRLLWKEASKHGDSKAESVLARKAQFCSDDRTHNFLSLDGDTFPLRKRR